MDKLKLGVVVITYNEERFIGFCIDSILKATHSLDNIETNIVVVDSRSNDSTQLIVTEKGIKFKLTPENMPRCAALGRWVGGQEQQNTDYILFLDGDMTLYPGFIEVAIEELRKDDLAAGAIGILDTFYYEGGRVRVTRNNVYNITSISKTKHFGGALLIKTSIYNLTGGYDPYIFAEEETELYSRIQQHGYYVLQLPVIMAAHHTNWVSNVDKLKSIFNPLIKKNYGVGQGLVRSIFKGSYLNYIKRQQDIFITLLLDIFTIILALINFSMLKKIWVIISIIFLTQVISCHINIVKKGHIKWFFINKARYLHLIYGFLYTLFHFPSYYLFNYKINKDLEGYICNSKKRANM